MKRILLMFFVTLTAISMSWAQRSVMGTVSDASGSPLIGANILAKGVTGVGTITDIDGKYKLSVPNGVTTLVVSYTGYQTQEVAIGTSDMINVTLAEGKLLDEIVVVGYGEKSTRFSTQSVASLGEKNIQGRPLMATQDFLQGQAAGVQMVSSSGVLGANPSVRIRGAASITGGGQPLYVVDGVPMVDDVRSGAQGGGTGLNPLLNIDPNDIESMSVLKDAAAAAIYGSRGSNGVIIITTKRGKNQKTAISLSAFTGTSKPTNLIEMMNTQQFSTFVNDYRTARGQAPQNFSTDYFNWVDNVVQTGTTNNINLSARGGNDRTTFYVGGSLMKDKGFTIGNEAERLSGRFNFDHKANSWLSLGANINMSRVKMDRIGVENNTFAPLTSAYLQLPFVLPRNAAGDFVNTGFIQNVLAIEELNTNRFVTNRLTSNAFFNFQLMEGLTLRTDWGIDNVGNDEKQRDVELLAPTGYGYRGLFSDNKWLTTNTLNYTKSFDKSSLDIIAGYAFETSRYSGTQVAGSGFATDGLPNVGSASTPLTTFEEGSEWALESQFLRATYNLNEKYIFEGTLRRDGSSRFGANFRYGNFYAVSGGWIISEEDFMKENGFFNFMKLTASYGTSGNDRIGNFSSLALYGGGVTADYIGLPGIRPTQTPNPDLTWEETAQLDLGLSTRFLDNRVALNVNVYDKKTNGILLNVPYPFTTGFPSAAQNVGKLTNRGIDLELNVTVLNKQDFTWTVGLNAGYLQNRVDELPQASVDVDGNRFVQGSAAQRAVEGRTLNEFYLVRALGVNPTTGDFEWLDKEGNPTTTYSANNRVFVGSAIPKYVGGLNTNFQYKNFDLSALFNFSYGNKVLIDGLRFTENLASPGFNKSTNVLNYWRQEGDQAFAPRLASPTAPLFNQLSTSQLQNGSFLRLRNVTLGYNIDGSVFGSNGAISNARVYVTGQNLFLVKDSNFRGPDPEVSANGPSNLVQGESFFALPQARTIIFGINVNF